MKIEKLTSSQHPTKTFIVLGIKKLKLYVHTESVLNAVAKNYL